MSIEVAPMAPEDRLERLLELITYLLDRAEGCTREQITDDFPFYEGESGRRRFEDDKKTFGRIGITLHTEVRANGATAYLIRRQDYEMPDLDLSDDESLALSLAMQSIDISGVLWGRLAGTKLRLTRDPVPTMAVLPGLELMPEIEEAARTRSRLRITYKGKVREIDPYGIAGKNGSWYVPAMDSRRGKVIPFRIDRIAPGSVEVLESGAFEPPADLDLLALVPGEAHTMGSEPKVDAVVIVDRRLLAVVAHEWPDIGALESCGGGEMRIHVPVTYVDGFVSEVLAFGDRVVVEGPPELRDEVVRRLRELAAVGGAA